MHIMGFAFHPLTLPVADQLGHAIFGFVKLVLVACLAVIIPFTEEFLFVWRNC